MFHNVPQKRVQVAILFQELFSSKPCQNRMESSPVSLRAGHRPVVEANLPRIENGKES